MYKYISKLLQTYETLTVIIKLNQSIPGSNDNEGVLYTP